MSYFEMSTTYGVHHSMTCLNRYREGGGGVVPPHSQPDTHCTSGWVGLGADKTGIRARIVQPVTNRYTDYAVPAAV